MKFNLWVENNGLGSLPTYAPAATTASDKVKQTGLQPQVNSHEIYTKEKEDSESIVAIDKKLERLEGEIPKIVGPKTKKFNKLWKKFKERWEEIKEEEGGNDFSPSSQQSQIPYQSNLGKY